MVKFYVIMKIEFEARDEKKKTILAVSCVLGHTLL